MLLWAGTHDQVQLAHREVQLAHRGVHRGAASLPALRLLHAPYIRWHALKRLESSCLQLHGHFQEGCMSTQRMG